MFSSEEYFNGEYYDFEGIKIADVHGTPHELCMNRLMPLESFGNVFGYSNLEIEEMGGEGIYIHENVDIDENDIVIDAGAYIGDFSAYGAYKKAKVYAFEPTSRTYSILKQTAALNIDRIIPVKKGLSDSNGRMHLFMYEKSPGGNTTSFTRAVKRIINPYEFSRHTSYYFENVIDYFTALVNKETVELTTLDDFVSINNLPTVDFIKADIEGAERYMLKGARKTISEFSPKLSLCTYHLPDDKEVLESLILDTNPNYIVIQNRGRLHAWIPDRKN